MGARPVDGRSAGPRRVRGDLPPVPRAQAARPPVSRTRQPAGRAPLVARVDVLDRPAVRAAVRDEPGRLRRFVRRHGWRAYAVPFLTVATLVTLVDLAVNDPAPAPSQSASATLIAPTTAAPPTSAVAPSAPAQGDAGPTETEAVTADDEPMSSRAPARCPSSTAARRSTAPAR